MDFEDKFPAKDVRSLSSSVQSTPDKNGHYDDASRSLELLQDFLKSSPKKELLRSCIDRGMKHPPLSKCKITQQLKANNKSFKNKDQKKSLSGSNTQSYSRKQPRKTENPIQFLPTTDHSPDFGCSSSWICKNSACRANISIDDTFCKRCSCCICHLFDENKDPSLWLECTSESSHGYSCGLSCHIECALQFRKVGVVDLGQLMQLDGSYCCASCGKVSGILGCWRKQMDIAKDARRVDILCFRIFLSYRLLSGTSRFKELHEIVNNVKVKLEVEVGPLNGILTNLARGIVSRLSIAGDVHKLCSLGIEKADEWLANISNASFNIREDTLPGACGFAFEEVRSSSVVIVLSELTNVSPDIIKGYKLWYCKSKEETYTTEPICVFPKSQRRIPISNLQPCTEYSFRIISLIEGSDLCHSEAKCLTKSTEIIHEKTNLSINAGCKVVKPEILEGELPSFSRGLDLNVLSVPDLNEEFTPPFESSRDEDNIMCNYNQAVDDAGSHEVEKICIGTSHGSDDSHISTRDSILINGSPFHVTNRLGCLDENFEYSVKMIRWLECEGHIKQDFRLKLLTWYSLTSTEQERRVVNTFIQTLVDDPSSLAGQLVDSFSDIITSSKKPRNGICSRPWH